MIIEFKLEEIILDPRLDMRANREQGVIDDYAENATRMPPGRVVRGPEGQIWLTDGWTRYKGRQKLGLKTMRCEVIEGSYLDAFKDAVGSNAEHGVRRTDADKRLVVRRCLLEPEWTDKSDRAIAEHCMVAHSFVAKVRARLEEKQDEERLKKGRKPKERPTQRVGKNGQKQAARKAKLRCPRCTRVCPVNISVPNCEACKALRANRAPEDAEDERERVLDAAGKIVPAHLEKLFSMVPIYQEGIATARKLKDILLAIERVQNPKKPLGPKVPYEMFSVVILRALQRLENLCPHIATHGLCDGNGCPACGNDGWQDVEEYKKERKTI